MATPLEDKLEDLTRWTVLACEHQRSGRVEDALTNMRKAGESAAKVIITSQWPGKRGTDATTDTSFAALIQLIIRNGLATKPTILLLQTLQVEGNTAAHDNRLKRGRVQLGMASLTELVHWLYGERLGRSLPAELREAFTPAPAVPTPPPKERSSRQADKRQEERIAQLEQRLAELSATAQRAEEDDSTAKAIAALRTELAEARMERRSMPVEEAVAPEAPSPAKRKGHAWVIGALVLAIVGIAGWFGLNRSGADTHAASDPGQAVVPATPTDSGYFTVVLIPPTILQDDPNITIDLVASLNNRLQRRIAERPYAGRIIVDTTHRATTPTPEQAWGLARLHYASLVIYGDLVEPTATDNGTASLSYMLDRQVDLKSGALPACRFRTMADSSVARMMDECVWLFDLALANRLRSSAGPSRALEVLYTAKSNTPEGELTRHVFMAQCHATLRNDPAALREAQWCIARDPKDPEVLAILGSVFTTLGDTAKAIGFFERALAQAPKNANYLLGLAYVLTDPGHPRSANNARSFALVKEALALDARSATAWVYAAKANTLEQDWKEAARCYERALQLKPEDKRPTVDLAQIEAFQLNKPEVAAQRLTAVIGPDSADPRALFLLAEIYTRTALKDPAAADKLYAKAKEKAPMARYSAEVGQADAAYLAGDMASAKAHYAAAWAMDSTDVRVANQYATALVAMHQDLRAKQVLQHGLVIDPANHMLNANIAQVLLAGPEAIRDIKAADRYFTASLATDPLDTFVLELSGNVKIRIGDMEGAEKLLREAYRLNPDSYGANRGLGQVRDAQGDLAQARMHYEKAIALKPTDDLVASNLAYVLLRISYKLVPQGLYWAKRSVELNRSPENLVMYANLLQASGKYNEAADVYYEAINGRPDLRQQAMEEVLKEKGLMRE